MTTLKRQPRWRRYLRDIYRNTPLIHIVIIMVCLWLLFSLALYLAERNLGEGPLDEFGKALYWAIAAFSTAGIADTPTTAAGRIIGGLWIIIGSVLFFGTIVAAVTGYFMRPLQSPHRMIIDTIEYNLERLDDLSPEEIELLSKTVDILIAHVEQLKKRQSAQAP